jgi:16S rRNA processing protein RimM
MNTTAYIELGIIKRRQGLRGSVVVRLYHDVLQLGSLSALFIQINHTLVPYCIEQLSCQDRKAIIKLQGVDDPDAARGLQGCSIFVPPGALPQLFLQAASVDKLLGYHVMDVREGRLGTVQAVCAPSWQKLLVIDYQGQELLVPYHDDIVTHVDHGKETIVVELPNGFIKATY